MEATSQAAKHGFFARLVRGMVRAGGWRVVGTAPDDPRFVLIGAPHTTNWDLLPALLAAIAFDLHMRWLGKSSLFRPPLGFFMRMTGGIPVERQHRTGAVDWLVKRILAEDRFVLCLAPEGTRSYVPNWRSGFYQIARAANLPVVLGFVDYSTRSFGLGPTMHLTGDVDADMKVIAAFYADKKGRHPELASPVRFAETESHKSIAHVDSNAFDETMRG